MTENLLFHLLIDLNTLTCRKLLQVVGDVVQTLAGAIFLDAKLDVELVWKVLIPQACP